MIEATGDKPQSEQLAGMQADALFALAVNAWMSMAAALVIAYTFWSTAQPHILLSWLAFDFTHALAYAGLAVVYKWSSGGKQNAEAWRGLYVWLMSVGGLVWGLAGLLFIPTGSPDQALVTALIAMGSVLATYPVVIYHRAFLAFQVPVFWLAALGFLASGNAYGPIMAGISILFSLSLIHVGRQMGDKLVSAMRLAIHNAEMVRTQEVQSVALAHANEELERLSYIDPLTGLANRRRLMIEMRTVGRMPQASLLIVDVDHFKQYNDTYGHGAGDVCLTEVARVMAHHARSNDGFAARYGGEEFCLLFAPSQADRVIEIAEALRADIQQLATVLDTLERPVTVSVGCAVRRADMFDNAFMRAADDAVYRAKREGRNRVARADEPAEKPLLAAV